MARNLGVHCWWSLRQESELRFLLEPVAAKLIRWNMQGQRLALVPSLQQEAFLLQRRMWVNPARNYPFYSCPHGRALGLELGTVWTGARKFHSQHCCCRTVPICSPSAIPALDLSPTPPSSATALSPQPPDASVLLPTPQL